MARYTIPIETKIKIAETIRREPELKQVDLCLRFCISSAFASKFYTQLIALNADRNDQRLVDQIVTEIINGSEVEQISEKYFVSKQTVRSIHHKVTSVKLPTKQCQAETRTDAGYSTEWAWLKKNWHWKQPRTQEGRSEETGLKIYRKGEKGHLRTPQRPDGIFR